MYDILLILFERARMDVLSKANWVDLLVVIIMLRTIYISFQDGLSREIFPLFSSIFKLALALYFYDKLGYLLNSKITVIPVSICNLVSFIAIILISGLALKFLKVIVDTIIKVTLHPLIEKAGGLLVDVLRGAVASSMVLIFLALIPLSYLQWSVKDKSLCGAFFLRIGPAIYRAIPGAGADYEKMVKDIISKKDIPAKANKAVKAQPEWEKVFNSIDNKTGGKK